MIKLIKNRKIILTITIITIFLTVFLSNFSLANTLLVNNMKKLEYSDEYKEWLKLPEEERKKVMMPNMYDIDIETDNSEYLNSIDNIFKLNKLLGASASATDSSFDLREKIPENLVIKNQQQTGGCWAFAMVAALETTFAKQDKENGKQVQEYDFSERHMTYATARAAFLNDAINEKGFTKEVSGGDWIVAQSYMTNGSGLIAEEQMRFENNENPIDIETIKNKDVITTLIDGEINGSPETEEERQALIKQIKEHLINHGGVWTSLHGAQINTDCYNNSTGAIYTNDSSVYPSNHAALIIGWNDTYEITNFNASMRPKKPGAWIIKNSWGTSQDIITIAEVRNTIYEKYKAEYNANNIYSADQIPDSDVQQVVQGIVQECEKDYGKDKVIVTEEKITLIIGDNGFMYVSYEDVNILETLYRITEAKNYKDYDNIYQYDYLGVNDALGFTGISTSVTEGYIANVFEANSSKEEITKISISTLLPYKKCRVYINPNGTSKKFEDLQLVDLAEGEYEKLEVGYNTIEFANPIKITGSSFVVVVELSIDQLGEFYFPVNMAKQYGWENVKVASNKSFVGLKANVINDSWMNVSDPTQTTKANLTIKAFTNNVKEENLVLSSIEIAKAPKKTTYNVGEKFDPTEMVVNALYTNGTKKAVQNYKVTNGDSLELNQKSVTISYTENGVTKTTTQSINVNEPAPTVTKIEVKTAPKKLEYIQNKDNLDLTGGVITATYSDATTKDIQMTNSEIKVTGFDKTKVGKQILTLTYKEKSTTLEVTVKAETVDPTPTPEVTLTKIEIKTKPKKLEYTQNKEDLDLTGGIITATYSDKTTEDIQMTNTNVKATGYDKTKTGKQTITITYKEKTASFEITVKEVEKRKPTLSNFKNSKANITKVSSYIYIKKDKEQYSKMTINLDGIEKGDNVSSREFYYYLSGNKGETNIKSTNWTKFDMNANKGIYSANLEIDTRNVKNAAEIAESESFYIYVKEIAKLDGNTTETVNVINIKKVVDVEIYLDDVKQTDIKIENPNEPEEEKKDDTTAKNPIPQTGVATIGLLVTIIIGIAIISYIKYRNIDR